MYNVITLCLQSSRIDVALIYTYIPLLLVDSYRISCIYTICMSSLECQQSMCSSCHSIIICQVWWCKEKLAYITMNHGTTFSWLQSETPKHLPSARAVLLKALVYCHCQKSDADVNCIECGNAWLTIVIIYLCYNHSYIALYSHCPPPIQFIPVYLRVQWQQSQTSAVCYKCAQIRSSSAWTESVHFMALV